MLREISECIENESIAKKCTLEEVDFRSFYLKPNGKLIIYDANLRLIRDYCIKYYIHNVCYVFHEL